MTIQRRLISTALLGLAVLGAGAVWALDAPQGKVVLTLSGQITEKNQGDTAVFTMAMLEKLPQHSFTTQTPWYPKPVEFSGPLLRDVLKAAGAKGSKLEAVALNDYKTEIPSQDATQHDVIVARLMNGKPMPVREKGPLFIVYPFDKKAELNAEAYYNRSAWQLARIIVK